MNKYKRETCNICSNKAEIIRSFSGEKYCIKHFRWKLQNEISKIVNKIPPSQNILIYSSLNEPYNELIRYFIEKVEKEGRKVKIIDMSSIMRKNERLSEEADEIGKLYTKFLIDSSTYAIILFRTADEIAHDIMLFIITRKFSLISDINKLEKRIFTPLKKYLSKEIERLSNVEFKHHCITMDMLKKISHTKPSVIFSIVNYSKHWREIISADT